MDERYSRHIVLQDIGKEGQKKISSASILIIGCGGTGTCASNLLARAGVGSITIVDGDLVDITNLQRQTIFTENDLGKPKVACAEEFLKCVNPEIKIKGIADRANQKNIEQMMIEADLVLDCTDDMPTRFLINDVCVKHRKPWIYHGAISTYGMCAAFLPGGACFRCLFPKLPEIKDVPRCDTVGVLNTIPGIIASMGVTEALKILMGKKPSQHLVVYDVWSHNFQSVEFDKNPNCKTCSKREFEFLEKSIPMISDLCGGTFEIISGKKIDIPSLAKNLGGSIKSGLLFLNKPPNEIIVFGSGRVLIKGASSKSEALRIYRRYFG